MKNLSKIFFTFFILFQLPMLLLFAQGVIEWQNTIGGSRNDNLHSIQQTTDGGFILGGSSTSHISGDKTENNIDTVGMSWDYWIIKTDSIGNIQWQNNIGGSRNDGLNSIQQTTDGGFILGGSSTSNISGDKTENNINPTGSSHDYWIVKTDSLGNIEWQNTIGGSDDDVICSIYQTDDDGYIIGGHSKSNISGDKSENNIDPSGNTYDYWILKTDSLGIIQWQKTIGGDTTDYLRDMKQTADGGYILGGFSISNISGNKTEASNGAYDYWILKIDSIGNIQWQNSIGGYSDDYLYSLQLTTDGGFIFGGSSLSNISGDKTENEFGQGDFWIVKTDSVGNIQWQNTIGGSNLEGKLYSIQQVADGGFIFGGISTSDISGDKTENRIDVSQPYYNYDIWIVKTDSSGNIQWQNTIGGINTDTYSSIQQTEDGGYILGGFSDSNISYDKTENSNDEDFWIIKLTENYNSLSGKLFIDDNSNSVQDSGEVVVMHKRITETNGAFAFSEQNGNYSIAVSDSGNYSLSALPINYYQAVPAVHNAYFPGILLTDSLNDFAFQPTGVFNDVCVTLTPIGRFRNGFNASYEISFNNVGTTTITGTVVFFPDSGLTYVSSSQTPASIFPDSIIWNYTLTPLQFNNITVTVNVNAGLIIGGVANSLVRIDPVAGDANPTCNLAAWEVFITGSFDPNEILVDEDTLWSTQFPNPPFLEYIIYFQNTGNDTAFTVKILNPIDTSRLDLNTLEFVSSSHAVNMNWLAWERNMEFKFNNILLPDSNTNEVTSHGFVRYRIQPKNNLTAGDNVANNAAIYFDYNSPVLTNSAVTQVVLQTGINQMNVKGGQLIVYPNPATYELSVSGYTLSSKEKTELKVYDVFGKEIFSTQLFTINYRLSTLNFPNGMFLLKVGNACARFVKQ